MITDDLDLMQLAIQGQLLACVDDTSYRAVRVVFACPSDGVPDIYCAEADWDATPAARMAELLRVNDRLVARVAELELRLAERPAPVTEPPVQNQERMLRKQAAALLDVGLCPDCDKGGWKSAKALQMHRQRAHQGMIAVRIPAQPIQFVEELGWKCAAKGCHGAHARDLHDPAFCTLHAARQITNGIEVPV